VHLQIFCDGACSKNPGPGGWAAVLLRDKIVISSVAGYENHTTNNRMELIGAIEGIAEASKIVSEMTVITDSIYVKDGITKWIFSWKKSNWKNGTVKNIDLWEKLSSLTIRYKVKWEWVKGHSGDKHNEMVDSLAREQIKLHYKS
jgi:ribonuclease HI